MSFLSIFRTPSHIKVAEQNLRESRRGLLTAESKLAYIEAMAASEKTAAAGAVAYHKSIILKLEALLQSHAASLDTSNLHHLYRKEVL